jgi:CO dehydrogenase maturation factor
VTHLFLITDSSKKGTQVISTIKKVADELVMYEKAGAIANRLPATDGIVPDSIREMLDTGDIPVLSYIPSDASLAEFDLKGENVFYLPADAVIVQGTKEALAKMNLIS